MKELDKEVFWGNLKKHGYDPLPNLHFLLKLPFWVPLPREMMHSVMINGDVYSFKFADFKTKKKLTDFSPEGFEYEDLHTSLEIIYSSRGLSESNIEDLDITSLLEYSFMLINDFLSWVSVYSHDYRVKAVSFESIDMIIPFKLTDSSFKDLVHSIFLNRREANEKFKVPSEEDAWEGIQNSMYGVNDSVFLHAFNVMNQSWRHILDGEFSSGVLLTQVAVESFLIILNDQLNEIDNSIDQYEYFSEMTKKAFGPRIGGNWSAKNKGYFAEYWTNCYEVRGEIMHGLRSVNYTEAKNAYYSAENFLCYVKGLLGKKKKYSRLVSSLSFVNEKYIPLIPYSIDMEERLRRKFRKK